MAIIYHNNKCSKSRKGLEYLQEKTQTIEIKEYMKYGITKDEIIEIISKLHCSVHDIIRTNEPEYKELIKGKQISDDTLIELIIQHPKLLQRPIVINKNNAVIARPQEAIDTII
mgnify:CR=1 FL=1